MTQYIIPNCHSPEAKQQCQAPFLRKDINLISLVGLPKHHQGPRCSFFGMADQDYLQLQNDGFMGLQSNVGVSPAAQRCKALGLGRSVGTPVSIDSLEKKACQWKQQGYECATILIGNGRENLDQASRLVERVLAISEAVALPIYIELHRGTVTQHIPLLLMLIERYPGLRFNGDFSHYVTAYRWDCYFDATIFEKVTPILKRVRFIQARLSDHRKAQSHQTDDHPAWPLFQLLWQQSFQHFKRTASPGDYFCFAPELLPRFTDYAEIDYTSSGAKEVGNRYQTARKLVQEAERLYYGNDQQLDLLKAASTAYTNELLGSNTEHLPYLQDLERFDDSMAEDGEVTTVILGTGLENEAEAEALLSAFADKCQRRPMHLKVHRGSITQNPFLLAKRLQALPNIALVVDVAEWVLAHEMRPDHLSQLSPILQQLAAQTAALINSGSTAERWALPDKIYLGLRHGRFCIPGVLALIYRQFYRQVARKLDVAGAP